MVESNLASCRESGAEPRVLESNEAVCLFAFVTGPSAHETLLPGDAREQRLMLHRVGSVVALTSIVPLTDYCGAEAERRLADITWLAPRVHQHATLVEWAMRSSPVFPAPFGTLYLSLDSLTAFMHAHEAQIADFLRTVAGKEEWELRASADLNGHEILEQLAGNLWPDWQALTKGTRYMRLCRDRSVLVEQGRAEAVALVHDFVVELQPLTAAVRPYGVRAMTEAGGLEPIARYALLVAKKDVTSLQESVQEAGNRAAHKHIGIALSGPWPPFSFRPNLESPY
jgi:hypothetical protein